MWKLVNNLETKSSLALAQEIFVKGKKRTTIFHLTFAN